MERDEALLRKVGDTIAAEPESYSQHEWFDVYAECGTTACVAGHAVMLHPEFAGIVSCGRAWVGGAERKVDELAIEMIGLSHCEALRLFDPNWRPAGDPSVPLHERVQAALYALSEGASVEEVTA